MQFPIGTNDTTAASRRGQPPRRRPLPDDGQGDGGGERHLPRSDGRPAGGAGVMTAPLAIGAWPLALALLLLGAARARVADEPDRHRRAARAPAAAAAPAGRRHRRQPARHGRQQRHRHRGHRGNPNFQLDCSGPSTGQPVAAPADRAPSCRTRSSDVFPEVEGDVDARRSPRARSPRTASTTTARPRSARQLAGAILDAALVAGDGAGRDAARDRAPLLGEREHREPRLRADLPATSTGSACSGGRSRPPSRRAT